jgi:predicted DNA binding CopG/RHH family protein
MILSIHEYIRKFAKDVPEGDVTTKFRAQPKIKPPRRESPVRNKSNRTDYMQVYMEKYREDGEDYQKKPQKIKDLKKKQKKERKKEGHIEDVRIYNKTLSASEINHIYIESKGNVGLYKEPTATLHFDSSSPNFGIGANYPTAMLNITSNDNNVLIIS